MTIFDEFAIHFIHVRNVGSNELKRVKERSETLKKSLQNKFQMMFFEEYFNRMMVVRTLVSNAFQQVKERVPTLQKSSKRNLR